MIEMEQSPLVPLLTKNQQNGMPNYKILGEVKEPQEHIGDSVGIHFDYGTMTHPIYGEGHVKGFSLCFQPFVDLDDMIAEGQDISRSDIFDALQTIANDMDSLGHMFSLSDFPIEQASNGASLDSLDLCLAVYPDTPLKYAKAFVLEILITYSFEEFLQRYINDGGDLLPIVHLLTDVLDGKILHLNDLPPLESSMELPVCHLILWRRECLKSYGDKQYSYLREEFLIWVKGEHKQDLMRSNEDLELYFENRVYGVGITWVMECFFAYYDPPLSDKIRNDPAFTIYKDAVSLHAGVFNDILSLRKEIGNSSTQNTIFLLAKTMKFQDAIETTVEILEKLFFKTKEAEYNLKRKFPNDEILDRIFENTGRILDGYIPMQSKVKFMYGVTKAWSYNTIEFSSTIVKQNWCQSLTPIVDTIPTGTLDKLSELDLDTNSNVTGGRTLKDRNNRNINESAKLSLAKHAGISENGGIDENGENVSTIKNIKKKYIQEISGIPNIGKCPKHLAIIPDGNRRWARSQGLTPLAGHRAGMRMLENVVKIAFATGIHTVTIWVLSSKNFNRTQQELNNIMGMLQVLDSETIPISSEFDAKVSFVGKRNRIPENILQVIERVEEKTKDKTKHRLNFAVDYDGREEIVEAIQKIKMSTLIDSENISEELISKTLWAGLQAFPDPDLIIRTGSKDARTFRTSGFMIWQSADSEFYFEDKYLPEINTEDMRKWLEAYGKSEQRLGL